MKSVNFHASAETQIFDFDGSHVKRTMIRSSLDTFEDGHTFEIFTVCESVTSGKSSVLVIETFSLDSVNGPPSLWAGRSQEHCCHLNSHGILSFCGNPYLVSLDRVAFNEESVRRIIIASSVEVTGDCCFENCYLESMGFEEQSHVVMIGEHGFYSTPVERVTLPASLETLGARCFAK